MLVMVTPHTSYPSRTFGSRIVNDPRSTARSLVVGSRTTILGVCNELNIVYLSLPRNSREPQKINIGECVIKRS